jgi:glutamyl-tRNA synthetase, archaeal and eukaryotic family
MTLQTTDIEKAVLKNALAHEGKADLKSIVNKLLGTFPELRPAIGSLMQDIKPVIESINALDMQTQISLAKERFPDLLESSTKEQVHVLPDLKNVHGQVVMRMAPSPSGPLHLGHSRMCILNDEYVKRYGGDLILRIEDTNPVNIFSGAYQMIPEDVAWLGVNVTKVIIQSERMELYYKRAKDLISLGKAYMCFCKPEDFKGYLIDKKPCPHRDTSPQDNLQFFDELLKTCPEEHPPVLVIKTKLDDPNPALRDWIAFRVIRGEHPHTGKKYHFYPLMNFSVAVDDHELGLTNVIRGMDHLNNTHRQKYIFEYLGWKKPEYFHYGLVNISDAILSTTTMRKGIDTGEFNGWDDVRLATLRALRARGYQPQTFRKYWIDSGLNDVNSEFSWDIFNSINRQFIDKNADRYFFVADPVPVKIMGAPHTQSSIPLYPRDDSRGFRTYEIPEEPVVFLTKTDVEAASKGDEVRLKDLYNVRFEKGTCHFTSQDNTGPKRQIIHWVPENASTFITTMPDGSELNGKLEPLAKNARGIIQFERMGFVNKIDEIHALYLHR